MSANVCPLCGDSMEPIKGEPHNWFRVVYRVDGGPWLAVADGPIGGGSNQATITVQRPGAKRIQHFMHSQVPEIHLVVQPVAELTYGTAHATCAQPLVDEANAEAAPS